MSGFMEEHRTEAGSVARREHVADPAVRSLKAGGDALGAVEMTVDADLGPERLDQIRERRWRGVRVQRGKVHRDHPGQAGRGAELLLRILDGERQPSGLALDVPAVRPLVPHLASGHRRRLGRRPQPRARDDVRPDRHRRVVQEADHGAVRLEEPPELRRRVTPPVVVVAPEEDLLPRPGIEPRQIVRDLRRLRRPGDVTGDDDRVVRGHRPVPGLAQRARVPRPAEAVHRLAAGRGEVRVSDGEEAHGMSVAP
jgi:hypothetical protein